MNRVQTMELPAPGSRGMTVREVIADVWVANPKAPSKEVYSLLPLGVREVLSFRKLQEHMRMERQAGRAPGEDPMFSPECPGLPWDDPDANVVLYRLYKAALVYPQLRPLTAGIAREALLIRKHFADDDVGMVNLITYAHLYNKRKMKASMLGKPVYREDLDGALAFRPWESEEFFEQYSAAVRAGIVPPMKVEEEDISTLEAIVPGMTRYLWPAVPGDISRSSQAAENRERVAVERFPSIEEGMFSQCWANVPHTKVVSDESWENLILDEMREYYLREEYQAGRSTRTTQES